MHVDFVIEHPQYIAPDNASGFLTNDGGETYNLCHCELSLHLAYGKIQEWC